MDAGNTALAWLSSQTSYKLRVDLWDWEGETKFGTWGEFSVGPATDGYRLKVAQFLDGNGIGKLCTIQNVNFMSIYLL
jgi:hypothetical protein